MKTAKVTNVQGSGTFKELYVFELQLDNNDTGKIYKKGQDAGVKIGDEINYTLNDKGSIKIQREGGGFNSSQSFKKDSNVQEHIIRQSSLKGAIDLVVSEKIEPHEWEKMADSFVEWVYGKKQVKEMPSFAEKSPF